MSTERTTNTTRRSPRIWFGGDGDYIGAVGVDTVEEFAALAAQSPDIAEALVGAPIGKRIISAEEIIEAVGSDVTALRVPTRMVNEETWDHDRTFAMGLDDKPGRGYVKTLGVSL